jgi:hypothetical protein
LVKENKPKDIKEPEKDTTSVINTKVVEKVVPEPVIVVSPAPASSDKIKVED